MKKMKLVSMFMVLALSLSTLAGCTNDAGGSEAEDGVTNEKKVTQDETNSEKGSEVNSDEKIVIEIHPDLFPEKMMESLEVAGLADKVEFRETPQNQYENKLRMMIAGGEVGDVMCIDAPNIAFYADMGALEPLNEYWEEEDFQDLVGSAQESVQWNGSIWTAPLNESNVVLYYNKEMFEEAGITPATSLEDAWTFEQLLDAAKKLTKKDASGNVTVYGILPQMFTPNNKNEGMTYTQMLWTWWAGADILSPDGTTSVGYFDSPENLKALQYYYDLHNTYKVAPIEDMQSGFAGGKIAMWINGPWMKGVWESDYPEFMDTWGVMPLPKDKVAASTAGSWNVAISKQSKNKELAFKVVQALTGKEGAKLYCEKTNNIPARKSILASEARYAEGELWQIINAQVMNNSKARPVTPVYPQISEAVMDCYNALAFGQDVESAVSEAVTKMEKALGN